MTTLKSENMKRPTKCACYRTFSFEYGVMNLVFLLILQIVTWFHVVTADCPPPHYIYGANMTSAVTSPYLEDTEIQYYCLTGYNEWASSRTWRCNGTHWVGGDLECTEKLCSALEPPRNGYIANQPTYEIGSFIRFECNTGYTLEGSNSLRCRIDDWIGSVPSCNVKFCGEFIGVANGNIFQVSLDGVMNDYGSVISVTCNSNYVLNGSPRITCGADGQWSDTPTCEPSVCPTYPVSHSACTDIAILDHDMYILYCVDDSDNVSATYVGPEAALCIDSVWTDTTMACYCKCKISSEDEFIEFYNLENGFLEHDTALSWGCKKGARKSSSVSLVCNDGIIGEANCIPPPSTTTTTTSTASSSTPSTSTTTSSSSSTSTKSSSKSNTSTTLSTSLGSSKTSSTFSKTPPMKTTINSKIQRNKVVVTAIPNYRYFKICNCDCEVSDNGLIEKHQDFQHDLNRLLELSRNCLANVGQTKDKLVCIFTDLGTMSCSVPKLSEVQRSMLTSNDIGRIANLEKLSLEVCLCKQSDSMPFGSANATGANFLTFFCVKIFFVFVYLWL